MNDTVPTTEAPKMSFVDRVKGGIGHAADHAKANFEGAGLGKKLAFGAGAAVSLWGAYDGIRRMVTAPVNEAGEKEEQSFGRVAAGALETGIALAALSKTVTGKGNPMAAFRA